MVFRYGNKSHIPGLPSFPHHKHLHDGVIASYKPELPDAMQEAEAANR